MTQTGRRPVPATSRNIAITAVGYLLPLLAALATAPILARELGVEGRGHLAAATAPFLLVVGALTLGVPESLTFFVARGTARPVRLLRRAGAALVAAALVGGGLLALAAPWLAAGSVDVQRIIVATTAALVPALWVGALRGAASGLHLWHRVTAERSISAGVRLVGVVALAVTDSLTLVPAAVVLVAAPVLGGLAYVDLGRHLRQAAAPDPEPPRLLGYGMRVWVGALSGMILLRLDQALIAPLSSATELGFYTVAVAIAEAPLFLTAAARNVVFAADSSERDDARLATTARLVTLIVLGAAVGLAALLPWAVPTLFGPKFADATPVTLVLLLAMVAGTPGSFAGSGLSSRGRPGLRSTSLVIACVVNVAVLVWLVPVWGALGAAVATLVGNLVSANLNLVWLRHHFGVSPRDFHGLRRSDLTLVGELVRRVTRGRTRER